MGCPNCIKEGLAILPVRYAVAPTDITDAVTLPKPLGEHVTDKAIKGSRYILRQLDRGFVYVLYPTKGTRPSRWTIYEVGPDACLNVYEDPRRVPPVPTVKPLDASCKLKKEDWSAQTIAIRGAKYIAHVWLAFSRYRLPQRVLDALEKTPEPRMQKLDVKAALAGRSVHHALPGTLDNLVAHVADFARPDAWNKLNSSGQLTSQLNERHADAGNLQNKMAEIAAKAGGKGHIFALFDPIGITADLNTWRNAEAGRLADYQKARVRERFVGDFIEGARTLYHQNGQAARWQERFLGKSPLYHAAKLEAERKQYEAEVETHDKRIDLLSNDVVLWNTACDADKRWHDFDNNDEQSARERLDAFASCIHGMGKVQAEQNLWDRWFAANPQDPYTPLWGAIGGSAPNLWKYFKGEGLPDIGEWNKANDAFKGLIQAHDDFKAWREKNQPMPALATISVATAGQLPRLLTVNPEVYRKAGYYLQVVVTATTHTVITNNVIAVTRTSDLITKAYEAVFRAPKGGALRLMQAEAKSGTTVAMAGVDGVVQLVRKETRMRKTVLQMWLPNAEASVAQAGSQARLSAPTAPFVLPAPQTLESFNPFKRLVDFARTGLPWVGFVMSSLNLAAVAQGVSASGGLEHPGDIAGLTSGVLGVGGAISELTVLGMESLIKNTPTQTARLFWVEVTKVRVAQVAFWGGVLAAGAAGAEGVQMFFKAFDQYKRGNAKAAVNYRGAGILFLLAGGAMFGGALAGGAATGAFVGKMAFLAPLGKTAAAVPVWGWIVGGLILTGVAVWFAWQAFAAEYSPLEDWVKHSYYGTATDRYSEATEREKLREVMYAYRLETRWTGMPRGTGFMAGPDGFDTVSFTLTLPAASSRSVIHARILLLDGAGQSRKTVLEETSRPIEGRLGLQDPRVPELRATPSGKSAPMDFFWEKPPRLEGDPKHGYVYSGTLRVDAW